MTVRPQVSVFIATSVDGFVARPDGSLDWLEGASDGPPTDGATPAEDYGYAAFIAGVDTLVMGRKTFEKVLTFGSWPYGKLPVVVLSRTLTDVPADVAGRVRISALDPVALVQELQAEGRKHLYVDGGQTVQAFLREGLVDELIVSVMPVLIGSGLPLFGPLPADVPLQLVEARSFPGGFVQVRYRPRG